MQQSTIQFDRHRVKQFRAQASITMKDFAILLCMPLSSLHQVVSGKSRFLSIMAFYKLELIHPKLFDFLCGCPVQIEISKSQIRELLKESKIQDRKVA